MTLLRASAPQLPSKCPALVCTAAAILVLTAQLGFSVRHFSDRHLPTTHFQTGFFFNCPLETAWQCEKASLG